MNIILPTHVHAEVPTYVPRNEILCNTSRCIHGGILCTVEPDPTNLQGAFQGERGRGGRQAATKTNRGISQEENIASLFFFFSFFGHSFIYSLFVIRFPS